MIPRATIHYQMADTPEQDGQYKISWFDQHPGDQIEQQVMSHMQKNKEHEMSDIIVYNGQMIYIRWMTSINSGMAVVMDAVSRDLFNIEALTFSWSKYIVRYHNIESENHAETLSVVEENHDNPDLITEDIPREIKREWFDLAISGGQLVLNLSDQFHTHLTNITAYFPWILFFISHGIIENNEFKLWLEIDEVPNLTKDELFSRIAGDIDKKFWVLVYTFIINLNDADWDNLATTFFRYLQAVHLLTKDDSTWQEQLNYLFEYKDLLDQFEIEFLSDYVRLILTKISTQEPHVELCEQLLQLSNLLLEFDLTDLTKLAEATTLEHALQLSHQHKLDIISELTTRSATWGDQHLVSFIQSLTELLPHESSGKEVLSEVINQVSDQLKQSWDGMLCLVEGKIIASKLEDASTLRFEATKLIGDKLTKGEDIFSAIIWSLQFDISPQNLYDIALPYLDFIFDQLPAETILNQSDLLTQRSLLNQRYEFLRLYFRYIRMNFEKISPQYHNKLFAIFDQLLTSKREYPLLYIEYLIMQLYAITYHDNQQMNEDRIFQLVGHIFNHINPSLSTSESTMRYISGEIIKFGGMSNNLAIVKEVKRRYLLLTNNQKKTEVNLKTIFLQTALQRAKLPGKKLEQSDIGLQLFDMGMELADLGKDFDIITRIIPKMKKMAIKSRSYQEFTNLVLTEIRLKKVHDKPWIEGLMVDINRIVGRLVISEINRMFKQIFELDLTEEEEKAVTLLQLELVELEPDLLTADEIYEKRLQLGQTQPDRADNQDFVINNYQQGISELMSKGDTTNLTNLLLDAISYSQNQNASALDEFKGLLVDNFANIIQDFRTQQSANIYLYMLTIWRNVIDRFEETDLSIITTFALRLYRLNLSIFRASENNQYLRRAQLVIKELSITIHRSPCQLDTTEKQQLLQEFTRLLTHLEDRHRDFGITNTIQQATTFYYHLDEPMMIFPHIDEAINHMKREIINDKTAITSVFMLLLLLCKVGIQVTLEDKEEIKVELKTRFLGIIDFSLSLSTDNEIKGHLREIQEQIHQSLEEFIQYYPSSLPTYLGLSTQI